MNYDLDFILQSTQGKKLSSPTVTFSGFATDNRDPLIRGKLFIPLVGEVHDAHRFVRAAIEAGAGGALVHRWDEDWNDLKSQATFISVKDTLLALQDFSKAWRKTFKGKVLALTGSNGKTTTKDFLYQILKNFGSVNASHGSFNNHWGVPFTLLNSDPSNDYCVVEMGMNHRGEIARLMTLADPDLVTVTNVGRAHMGNFANGIEGVATAKEEIYEMSKAQASLLFNLDNPKTLEMYKRYMDRITYTYSTKNFSADVFLRIKEKTSEGLVVEGQIGGVLGKANLSFWGDHNVENLAAATALAYIGGAKPEKIWSVLENCHTGWGRNQWIQTESPLRLLFDGYNANPDSFQMLLQNVKNLAEEKQCSALFGEMLELGNQTSEQHRELGKKASQLAWKNCVFVGPSAEFFEKGWNEGNPQSKCSTFQNFSDFEKSDVLQSLKSSQIIVIKGSRGGALERAIPAFSPVGWKSKS